MLYTRKVADAVPACISAKHVQAGSPLSWELSVSHHVAANAADIGHSYAALRALLTAVQALIDSVAPAGVLPSKFLLLMRCFGVASIP